MVRDTTKRNYRQNGLNNRIRALCRRYGAVYVENVDLVRLWERDGGQCWLCKWDVPKDRRFPRDPATPTADHVVPLAYKGEHSYANVRLAHWACNAFRSKRTTVLDRDAYRVFFYKQVRGGRVPKLKTNPLLPPPPAGGVSVGSNTSI